MPCAPGTVFNPAIGVCDHPYNVPKCGDSKPSNCSVKWSSWFNTHHPEPYMTSGDWETINHIEAKYGPICTKSTISDVQCVCAGSASDWTTTGDVMTCNTEEGLVCRNSQQSGGFTCVDYKIRFLCSGECGIPPESTAPSCHDKNGKPLSTGPIEKPGDCDHFYQCGAGVLYVMPCAPGTAFNPELGVCDWPYNVPGC
ncbi:mucin-2-like [Clavelina lepadiformis]|uniref:mucin-2-like n=1 Tax=Clavelina lepadiformis TaxID=159417 RepID=UPI004041C3DD